MPRCIYISQLTIFRNIDDNLMTCFIQLSFNFIFGPRNYMFILLMIFMQRYKSFIFTKKNIRQSITLHKWPCVEEFSPEFDFVREDVVFPRLAESHYRLGHDTQLCRFLQFTHTIDHWL